jgi:hypothetical protein
LDVWCCVKKADRAELGRYVRWVANEIGLRDWTLNLYYDGLGEEDLYADCTPIFGRKVADIRFCSDFREQKPEAQRHTVVHELLHCHFAQEQEFLRTDMCKHLGQPTYDMFFSAYKSMHEYAIDGVADGIESRLPVIAWPKGK